jgi:Uma2 family endonuclease
MATVEALLTAEEYGRLPDDGRRTELVRGRIVAMNMPYPRHGQICVQTVYLLKRYLDEDDRGQVVCNDSGVITERDPDTVRGADVAFYSYARAPKGPLPKGYLPVAPDAVFEVHSPDDRWNKIHKKVGEYLNAGVTVVCVLDPDPQTIHGFHADRPAQVLQKDDEFALPEILGNFRVPVRRFFE